MSDRRIIIVGGGPGGAETVRAIISNWVARGRSGRVKIFVIEPNGTMGAGAAWGAISPLLACNMPAPTLSLEPLDAMQIQTDLHFSAEDIREVAYLAREQIGDWLKERWRATQALAKKADIAIEVVRDFASEIHRHGEGFEVLLGGGAHLVADQVVLALGGIPSVPYPHLLGNPGYYANGWNIDHIVQTMPPGARVAVLGSGPTAIDIMIALNAVPRGAPVELFSRKGKVPWVRPRYDHKALPHFTSADRIEELVTWSGPLKLSEASLLVLAEFAARGVLHPEIDRVRRLANSAAKICLEAGLAESDAEMAYYSTLKAIDPVTPYLWRALSQVAKFEVVKYWRCEHARISYAIPPMNAERMLRALDDGSAVVRGNVRDVRFDERRREFLVMHGDLESRFDVVVNATGFGGDLSTLHSPLVAQMADDGLLASHRFGGARVTFTSGAVLDASDRRVPGLYCVAGSLTIGVHFFVNSLLEAAKSARRTASAVVDEMLGAIQAEQYAARKAFAER